MHFRLPPAISPRVSHLNLRGIPEVLQKTQVVASKVNIGERNPDAADYRSDSRYYKIVCLFVEMDLLCYHNINIALWRCDGSAVVSVHQMESSMRFLQPSAYR